MDLRTWACGRYPPEDGSCNAIAAVDAAPALGISLMLRRGAPIGAGRAPPAGA